MKKLVILVTSLLMSSALIAGTRPEVGPRYSPLGNAATLTITGTLGGGATLTADTVLYSFDSTAQGWRTAGTNVDTVFSTGTATALPAFDGNYLYLETNATNTPFEYRAAEDSSGKYIDLSKDELVGAARTWGGLPSPDIYNLKVFLQGPSPADTISAVANMTHDDWVFFALNVSQWAKADSVTKIWIGIAYAGPQSSSVPTAWDGKAAFDQIGLLKIVPPGQPALISPTNNATGQPTSLTLKWGAVAGAAGYDCQVATDPTFNTALAVNDSALADTTDGVAGLLNDTTYYWRVRAYNVAGIGPFSATDTFATAAAGSPNNWTIVDDTSRSIDYEGTTWQTANWSGYIDNTAHYTWEQDSVKYTFYGTGIKWIAATGSDHGEADVYLDGVFQKKVDLYSAGGVNQVVIYADSSLNKGQHTIQIIVLSQKDANASGAFVDVDAFEVANMGVPPINWTVVDDTSKTIDYEGTTWQIGNWAGYIDTTTHYTWEPDSVKYTFKGTGIKWIAATNADHGEANVYLDGAFQKMVDLYSASSVNQVVVYADSALSDTVHTIQVVVLSEHDANATGSFVDIDAFEVANMGTLPPPPAAPATPVLLSPANRANDLPTSLTLKWSAMATATGYQCQVSTDPTFATNIIVNDSALVDTADVITSLGNHITYYWHVRAYNGTQLVAFSPYSAADTFTTIVTVPPEPAMVSPAVNETGVPRKTTFEWKTLAIAKRYELQIATDTSVYDTGVSVSAFLAKNVVFDTTVTDTSVQLSTPLAKNTKYYWHVSATDTAGTSGYGAPIAFTTGTGLTAVNQPIGVPKTFALFQNYPNPFNPTTTIKYNLPKAQMVTLRVYNVLGQLVATLVDGRQSAGYYQVDFNADRFASGVYFYVLRTDNFRSLHKMLLLK